MSIEIVDSPAPNPQKRTPRLTDEMRNLAPGQSFISDRRTVEAYVSHCRHHGKKTVRKTHGDSKVQVWRVS